ncbi:MAG: ABC transporter permease [Schaedlerella sp.]|nr:ABC transporter permease [Schaedlerella sp.]
MKNVLNKDKNLTRMLAVFVVCFAVFSITKGEAFLSVASFQSMGKLFPEFGLLSIGMALALLTGGIDLSVVYLANLCSICAALTVAKMSGEGGEITASCVLVGVLVALLIGAIGGAVNGALISVVGIPAMLATLGTQSLFNGLSVVISDGSTVTGVKPLSEFIGMKFLGVPVPTYIFVISAVVVGFIISKTTLGYKIKMLGTSAKACAFSGFNNVKLTIINYTMVGLLSAVSGIVMLGRYNSAKADNGASYTMQAIMIAVMGGVDPAGGKGNIQGVCVAVLIIQMVSTWLNMFQNISNFYKQIIWGALLIIILILNYYINKHEVAKAAKK